MDYPKNVLNFSAKDISGNLLQWEKTAKSNWEVITDDAATVIVNYDVYANSLFVASSYLDDEKAFIVPAIVFMFLKDHIKTPVTVIIQPKNGWQTITTGLDSISNHTYYASDFDYLFDCPILIGNHKTICFTVK
jgi:predicted metalloprotease with PDZ domain